MTNENQAKIPTSRMTPAQKRKQRAEEGRKMRAAYFRYKEVILQREKDNDGKLYLLKTHDGWGWKMFSHSALIYAHEIAPKLQRNVKLREDTDFRCRTTDGVVTIKSLETVKEELKIIKAEMEFDKDGLVIFNLKEKFSKEQIEQMRRDDEKSWEDANKLVDVPKMIFPMLNKELKATEKILYENVRKFNPSARVLIGDRILQTISSMMENFMMTMKGRGIEVAECLEFLMEESYRLESQHVIVCNEKLTDAAQAKKIAFQIQELERRIDEALEKEKKKSGTKKKA